MNAQDLAAFDRRSQKLRPAVTPAQLKALRGFAGYYGRGWKITLRFCWENGWTTTDRIIVDTAELQRLRNSHGPSWLVSFRLPRGESA